MLVELLIALGVATLAIVGLVSITTRSISNAGYSKRQSTATAYATQAMEWIRSQKNTDWKNLTDHIGVTYCLNSLAWTTGSCPKVLDSGTFSRDAVISSPAPGQIQAVVTVKWSEASKDFSAKQTSVFARY